MTDNSDEPQRAKRPPPTIELEAGAPGDKPNAWQRWNHAWRARTESWRLGGFSRPDASRLPLLTALGGVAVTVAVLAMLWWSGLVQQLQGPPVSSAATSELAARLARIEAQ